MPVTESIDRIVADIHHDLGTRTAWIANMAAQDADAARASNEGEELAGAVDGVIREIPSVATMPRSTKHNDTCHTRHAPCLAAKIRAAVEDRGYSCVN